jgi:hypothetical protein
VLARFEIAVLDPVTERQLLVGAEQGDLVDLLEVGLEAAFSRNGATPVGGSRDGRRVARVGGPPGPTRSMARSSGVDTTLIDPVDRGS